MSSSLVNFIEFAGTEVLVVKAFEAFFYWRHSVVFFGCMIVLNWASVGVFSIQSFSDQLSFRCVDLVMTVLCWRVEIVCVVLHIVKIDFVWL